jgi:hypothetical protein
MKNSRAESNPTVSQKRSRISKPRKNKLRELALHILDIAENSISAGADKIKISVIERYLMMTA